MFEYVDMKGKKIDVCQVQCIHPEAVGRVKEQMPSQDILMDLADFFKVFGDHTRIRILTALYREELCVCDLVEVLGMNQSAVSHQLRVLRGAKVVKFRKEGKMVFYSLDDEHVCELLSDGLAHIQEDRGY
ncbi:MAG: metalloregulator ArsR/SmtB family transcription factor [Desulfobacterium sp.]